MIGRKDCFLAMLYEEQKKRKLMNCEAFVCDFLLDFGMKVVGEKKGELDLHVWNMYPLLCMREIS